MAVRAATVYKGKDWISHIPRGREEKLRFPVRTEQGREHTVAAPLMLADAVLRPELGLWPSLVAETETEQIRCSAEDPSATRSPQFTVLH